MRRDQMIDSVRAKYSQAFLEHGDSDQTVLLPKGRQFLRFDTFLPPTFLPGSSVLDFGCGLGKMVDWIDDRGHKVSYTGADITPEFVDCNRKKFPGREFLQIQSHTDLSGEWDFVAACGGVFNLLYTRDRESHVAYVFEVMEWLFKKCTRKQLIVDFMHDQVNFVGEGAFHIGVADVDRFVSQRLSGRYEIIRSYLPYEFCVKVWKNTDHDEFGYRQSL